jgi:hypothetical protein
MSCGKCGERRHSIPPDAGNPSTRNTATTCLQVVRAAFGLWWGHISLCRRSYLTHSPSASFALAVRVGLRLRPARCACRSRHESSVFLPRSARLVVFARRNSPLARCTRESHPLRHTHSPSRSRAAGRQSGWVSGFRPGRLALNPAFDLADEREVGGVSSHENEPVFSRPRFARGHACRFGAAGRV